MSYMSLQKRSPSCSHANRIYIHEIELKSVLRDIVGYINEHVGVTYHHAHIHTKNILYIEANKHKSEPGATCAQPPEAGRHPAGPVPIRTAAKPCRCMQAPAALPRIFLRAGARKYAGPGQPPVRSKAQVILLSLLLLQQHHKGQTDVVATRTAKKREKCTRERL